LWVFVSTVGELNAIEALLRQLCQRLPQLRLVLITDRPQYAQAYANAYPAARVHITAGGASEAQVLATRCPPAMLLVAEIPCLPFDAPCRFSCGYVAETRRLQAPVVLVNGWLFAGRPASRMDVLEARLFTRAYLRAFDLMPGAMVVIGNLKFDNAVARPPSRPFALNLARQARRVGRRILVAGSVNDPAELDAVINGFALWQRQNRIALLVLAPRHPEDARVRARVEGLLDAAGLGAQWLSQASDASVSDTVDCMVIDTFGELQDCYAVCDLAHVGINHNVLEPIAHRKPVTVMPGWRRDFPSFPVYSELMALGALTACSDADALVQAWAKVLKCTGEGSQPAAAALHAMRGATARCMLALEPLITGVKQRHSIALGARVAHPKP
jgi:3-deoxy-D-manno-octulosonic-acid transferase